ncbi:hypothetical protein PI124_g8997 [Phytophthora idaei]|nr:hypothetical protein PI124_g8997 [Phytophthora idaei]
MLVAEALQSSTYGLCRKTARDGENGSGSEDGDTRTEGEGDGVEQKEERQGVRAEVERLEERRRAATGSHPWFARDEATKDDVTAEEQEQSEIMGELLATGDEDEFADAAKGSDVASPRRGTAAVTTEIKTEPEVKEEQEEDTDAFGWKVLL